MADGRLNWNELDENNSYTCEICPEYNDNLKVGNDISRCYKQCAAVHRKRPACNWFYSQIKEAKRSKKENER